MKVSYFSRGIFLAFSQKFWDKLAAEKKVLEKNN